jgi:hypothetical protein
MGILVAQLLDDAIAQGVGVQLADRALAADGIARDVMRI